eukprot:8115970-Alexandrium_andersonii.AAC.1
MPSLQRHIAQHLLPEQARIEHLIVLGDSGSDSHELEAAAGQEGERGDRRSWQQGSTRRDTGRGEG